MIKRSFRVVFHYYNVLVNMFRGYSDYFMFPFDVNAPLNEFAERTLDEGASILESLKIPYYVCDGTILGIVRDKQLIAHDNDIDVAVAQEVDLELLISLFIDRGFNVGRKVFYRGKIQQLILYSEQQVIFDICFWRAAGDGYHYHFVPETPKGRRQQDIYFTNPEYVSFCGRCYPTHPRISDWLLEHYGNDWRVPKRVKGDWRLDVQDIVK